MLEKKSGNSKECGTQSSKLANFVRITEIYFLCCAKYSHHDLKNSNFKWSKNSNQQIYFTIFGQYLRKLINVHQCNIWHASCVAFYSFQLNLDYELQNVSILIRLRGLKKVSKF